MITNLNYEAAGASAQASRISVLRNSCNRAVNSLVLSELVVRSHLITPGTSDLSAACYVCESVFPRTMLENGLDYTARFRMLQFAMRKLLSALSLAGLAVALFTVAPLASAHERDTFKIGSKYYVFTVGSLNEPFVVDSISGVDLRVSQVAAPGGPGSGRARDNGTPVVGLEQTLKVELIAGNKKKRLSLDPSDSAPGSYAENFIPTVQTTYSYRFFGTINGSSVDLTFTCVPGEVSETAEDNSQLKVSDTVTRLSKVGAFGCPIARKAMGFPEPALSSYDLDQNAQNFAAVAQTASKQASMAQILGIVGIIIGLSGLVVAGIIWKRK